MYYAAICSFASVFLLDKGYSNESIGIILAVGSILAVLIQPALADLADKSKKISVATIISFVAFGLAFGTALLFAFEEKSLALTILFVMLVAWHTVLQPLVNSLSFRLEAKGIIINFGIARSMGSLAYSILCMFLGNLVMDFGVNVLPLVAEIVLAMMLVSIWLTNRMFRRVISEEHVNVLAAENNYVRATGYDDINLLSFIDNNKAFVGLNVAVVFIFFGNSLLNSFMMQIVDNVGGSNVDLGRLLSIMAFLEIPTLFFFSKIKKFISYENMLKLASVAFLLKMLLFYFSKSTLLLYVAQGLQPFSFALFLPAMIHFTNSIMSKGEAVKGQALFTTMITVSTVFATAIGGYILDVMGAKPLLLIGVIFNLIGLIIVTALVEICFVTKGVSNEKRKNFNCR